jgi:hypothetical protein
MRVLLAASLLIATLPAWADDPAGPGLDLLLLVDRSGSMSTHSPAAIVDALPLALNVVTWSSRSARVNHRFSIVSFGSRASTDVPLTIVDTASLPVLRNRIGALASRSLGRTNLIAAFEAAAEAFRGLPADSRRKRAILLLTDGHIDVPGLPERAAARDLERLLDSAFTRPPVSIDVLLFGAREGFPSARVARNRAHRVRSDRGDLLATLHRVINEIVGARSSQREIGGATDTLVLPPYLELVVFDIFRGGSAQEVAVLAPDSSEPLTARTPGVEMVHAGDVMATVVVRRPAAGAWVFRKSDPSARVRVLSQQFFPRGTLVQPAAAPPVRQYEEVTIGYRLADGAGRPLQEYLRYPLSVDVSLALPNGQRVVLPMMRDAASSSSLYRTRATECSVAGRYWTEVLVTTADSSGQPVRIFEDRWSGFTVDEARQQRPTRAVALDSGTGERNRKSRSFGALKIGGLTVPLLVLLCWAMWRR